MIEVAIAACGGAAVAGVFSIITLVMNRKERKREKHSALITGVQALLYCEIKTLANRHIREGQICTEDLEDLIRMHQVYHDDLNGNGYLDSLMKAVRKLPIK